MNVADVADGVGGSPPHVATALAEHGAPKTLIDDEIRRMRERRLAKTADRSVVGVMTEFARLAEFYRQNDPELPELAARLADVPCSPLYKRHVSPGHEFDALLRSLTADGRAEAAPRGRPPR